MFDRQLEYASGDLLGGLPRYHFDDEVLASARKGQPSRQVYAHPNTLVVVGRGSKIDSEIDLDACRVDEVPVFRRMGGGCAVVIDPGNAIISVGLPVGGIGNNQRYLNRLTDWIARAMERIGVEGITQAGISDLAIDGQKVSGSCIHRGRDLLYFSATLLIQPDLGRMGRYLRHPPREPKYRDGRTHNAFLTNIEFPRGVATVSQFCDLLEQQLDLNQLEPL